MSKFLIVGLGNIGKEYEHTRHNIGFDVLNAFVQKHDGNFATERLAYKATVSWKGKIFVCICPTTFMNLSGKAVKYWVDKEKMSLDRILVILDEVALPLSRFRLRGSGSSGGHNGLKSIESELGTDQYPRLRFGIGADFPKGMQADFVLGKWKKEEEAVVRAKIQGSVAVIESFAAIGLERTMNEWNKREFEA